MGPRSFDRGNAADGRALHVVHGRFNGAAVIRPRKSAHGCEHAVTLTWLQWGRGHSTAEMSHAPAAACRAQRASMGPRSFDRGNAPRWHDCQDCGRASMGPRSFDRGNQRCRCRARGTSAQLQWGRGHSTAEITCRRWRLGSRLTVLQWGRGHSTAEMRSRRQLDAGADAGFNGAAVIRPRKYGQPAPRPYATAASMGPRSFDRGNDAAGRRRRSRDGALQWGRGHSTAEMSALHDWPSRPSRAASMGPRSFDRGNDWSRPRSAGDGVASMGPRSFDRGNGGRRPCQPRTLQWGRGHSTAEMSAQSTWRFDVLQWGRGHSTAEMAWRDGRCTAVPISASMGPRSFDRGNAT